MSRNGQQGGDRNQQGGPVAGGHYGGEPWGPRDGIGRRDFNLPDNAAAGPIGGPGAVRPGYFEDYMRNAVHDLAWLDRQVRNDPNLSRDVQDLMRAMQNIDPRSLDNPLIYERIRQQVLSEMENVEMQLRRKVDDTEGASVRSPSAENVPPGYADAVAEYFRKLSKAK
ncbi:MAG TPA: hypothetical protein VMT39_03435 [Candidatus Bathyarchaeia archaeon]|nr:hypothetical protein [Candidatus Bathyarchaeia archaeon]